MHKPILKSSPRYSAIFPIKSVSCLRMEVPCCGGMTAVLKEAIKLSGKDIPLTETVIGVKGDVLGERDMTIGKYDAYHKLVLGLWLN